MEKKAKMDAEIEAALAEKAEMSKAKAALTKKGKSDKEVKVAKEAAGLNIHHYLNITKEI